MRYFGFCVLTIIMMAAVPAGNDAGPSSENLRHVSNRSFCGGEKLEYRLHYGIINAGTATIEVQKTPRTIFGRPLLHIVGTGHSNRTFDLFYKVRDRYESYIDKEGLFPWLFIRRVDEGGYRFSQDYKFVQHKKKVHTQDDKDFEVPVYIQDMLSAFYYARTSNMSQMKINDTLSVDCFMDDEIWPLQCKYLGKEQVSIDAGTFRCLRFAPIVQQGRIFKDEEDLIVYISDDDNHIPVLAQANVLVGSIKMELTSFSGLSNPPAKQP